MINLEEEEEEKNIFSPLYQKRKKEASTYVIRVADRVCLRKACDGDDEKKENNFW